MLLNLTVLVEWPGDTVALAEMISTQPAVTVTSTEAPIIIGGRIVGASPVNTGNPEGGTA